MARKRKTEIVDAVVNYELVECSDNGTVSEKHSKRKDVSLLFCHVTSHVTQLISFMTVAFGNFSSFSKRTKTLPYGMSLTVSVSFLYGPLHSLRMQVPWRLTMDPITRSIGICTYPDKKVTTESECF